MTKLNKITQPNYVGPGVWYIIHLMSINESKYNDEMIKLIMETFPCGDCRHHFAMMMKNVKWSNNIPLDWFKIHNIVNDRLGKECIRESEYVNALERVIRPMDKFRFEVFGPGIWWFIHSSSVNNPNLMKVLVVMLSKMKDFRLINEKLQYLPKDESKYLSWSWDLHDYVNGQLYKSGVSIEKMIEFYKDGLGCSSGCGKDIKNSSSFRSL